MSKRTFLKETPAEMSVLATTTIAEGNHVHGGITKRMHSSEGVLIHYKRKRTDAQSSSEQHDFCSIKHKKSLEAPLKGIMEAESAEKCDKEQTSSKLEEKGEAHTLYNQQEKNTASTTCLMEKQMTSTFRM